MRTVDQPLVRADTARFRRFSDSVELAPCPASVGVARLHVRRTLRDWNMSAFSGDAEQVVSELIANSATATETAGLNSPVRLTLLAGPASVLVAVWDGVPAPPVRANADADAENGRGLMLVEAFSSGWSWKPLPPERGGGKIVRATIGAC